MTKARLTPRDAGRASLRLPPAAGERMMRLAAVRSKVHLKAKAMPGPRRTANRGVTVRAPSEPVKNPSADVEEFARNVARMIEEGGKALAAYLKPREEGRADDQSPRSPTW